MFDILFIFLLQRITNTTSETSTALSHVWTDQVIDVDLSKLTVYRVQIRQRSNQAPNPLWSDWSPVMIVPAGEVMDFHVVLTCDTDLYLRLVLCLSL